MKGTINGKPVTFEANETILSVARRHASKLRLIALSVGGIGPLLLTLAASSEVLPTLTLSLAAAMLIAGLLVERWLFFAEARHAVMSYYDRRAS